MSQDTGSKAHGRPEPHSGQWTSPRDLTGRTLADFHVERQLGRGGMGEVYLARQVSLDRPVALKVLKPELASNPTYMARFEAEAWAAAKLNHPNIVHIYTLGGVDRLKFIAMEYVAGTNLREFLSRKGVPELPLAISIMKQAGQAVGAAGEAGLVHRDIKPENLLLTRKGQVKVADFGLCRVPDSKVHLTQEGVTLGTPLYMSPEQVQGQPTDHRSDLYSLGVTFYQMLSGKPPFTGEAPLAIALKHVREKPVSLAVHRPDLPPDLIALVMRLLEKDRNVRYQNADEMLKDLAKIKEQVTATLDTQTAQPRLTPADEAALAATVDAQAPTRASWSRWRRALEVPRLGRKVLTAVLPLAFAAGALGGWFARPTDLLAPNQAGTSTLPGLWMENWEPTVPAFRTAQAQYRYAQTRVEPALRPAAWLAVPGRFPTAVDVSSRAYVQLIRDMVRRADSERLQSLAEEFAAERERSGREIYVGLARMALAGASALRNDATAVLDQFGQGLNIDIMDPALAELGYEIVVLAGRTPSGAGTNAGRLEKLRTSLLEPLQVSARGFGAEPPGN
jgi:serine/threonine-protein kinase